MIRVLHVIDSLDLGGAQTVLVNLARFRDRTRYEVTVAAMHGRGVFAEALAAEGVEVVSLSAGKFPPVYLWSLPCLLRRKSYDIVHAHLFASNWMAKPLAALCGVPVRVNHDHCNDRARAGWRLWVDRLMNRFSSHVIAVSASTRADLLAREKLAEDLVTFLPNGVDTSRFRPAGEAERVKARGSLGVSGDRPVVVGLGRLHPQKNWPLFLRVAERFPQADFVIAGTGPEESVLRGRAPDNVRLVGFRDSREVMAAADVFLLTSHYEGMPMTLLEAMACGIPAVATRCGGPEGVITDGVDGFLVGLNDEVAMAARLTDLLQDAELNQRMGQGARARVEAAYTEEAAGKPFLDTWQQLAGAGRGAAGCA
jgi:glycosyltransferase involved in cell wall biosynthesis